MRNGQDIGEDLLIQFHVDDVGLVVHSWQITKIRGRRDTVADMLNSFIVPFLLVLQPFLIGTDHDKFALGGGKGQIGAAFIQIVHVGFVENGCY